MNRTYTVLILRKGEDPNVWQGATNLNEDGLKDLIQSLERAGVE